METLAQIYARHTGPVDGPGYGDKGSVHSYIPVYEQLLGPYRGVARRVLEIGILNGTSLRMWEEYFAGSEVHGIDLDDRPHGFDLRPMIAEGTHRITLINAISHDDVEKHFDKMQFDVIIEDASHALAHQLMIYENFRGRVAPGGIYIIEDVDNIDRVRPVFEIIDPSKKVSIVDRRFIKGRFDDVLVVIQ